MCRDTHLLLRDVAGAFNVKNGGMICAGEARKCV